MSGLDTFLKNVIELNNSLSDISRVSQNGAVTYACDSCEEEFDLTDHLLSHTKELHPLKQFVCEPCNKTLANYETFKEHTQTLSHVKSFKGKTVLGDLTQKR